MKVFVDGILNCFAVDFIQFRLGCNDGNFEVDFRWNPLPLSSCYSYNLPGCSWVLQGPLFEKHTWHWSDSNHCKSDCKLLALPFNLFRALFWSLSSIESQILRKIQTSWLRIALRNMRAERKILAHTPTGPRLSLYVTIYKVLRVVVLIVFKYRGLSILLIRRTTSITTIIERPVQLPSFSFKTKKNKEKEEKPIKNHLINN